EIVQVKKVCYLTVKPLGLIKRNQRKFWRVFSSQMLKNLQQSCIWDYSFLWLQLYQVSLFTSPLIWANRDMECSLMEMRWLQQCLVFLLFISSLACFFLFFL